jgi:hypothetical protein
VIFGSRRQGTGESCSDGPFRFEIDRQVGRCSRAGREEGSANGTMAKKPFAKPRIVRRKEKLATIVQFTSGGTVPPRRAK